MLFIASLRSKSALPNIRAQAHMILIRYQDHFRVYTSVHFRVYTSRQNDTVHLAQLVASCHTEIDCMIRSTSRSEAPLVETWPVDLQCWRNFFLLYSKWLVQMARDLRNSHWTALHIFKFAWLYRCRGLQVWPRHSWCVVCVCDAICNADIWGGRQIWQRLMPRALLPQEHFEPLPIFLKTLDFAAYFECVNSNALIWL